MLICLRQLLITCLLMVFSIPAWANLPGGGTGTGANVTLTDNGNTVTMANGIVSIVITKTDASIHAITYTYNNSGTVANSQLLTGGTDGGMLYWLENPGSFLDGPFTETVVANNGSYAEISLSYASATNGIMDVHYSMLRGSTGFYTTAILTHRTQDGAIYTTLRPNIYAGTQFNWMSVDAARNRLMEVTGGLSIPVQGAPAETYLWTNGLYAGRYDDKYKYTANLAIQKVWGWSSVGTGGSNIGIWNVSGSAEYYPAGPLERSLMEHIGTTILNVFTGGYYGMGTDGNLADGETWTKAYGPYFYYCNNVTNTLTSTNQAAMALYADALAQCAAEQSAWPYVWFTNANYAPASGRGTVTGKIIINDTGNPNASAAGMWVGVTPQPGVDTTYDFQQWTKPYQFWVQADTNGNFTIPNVIAGTNYTLFAFGTGAAGTFQSQNLTGGAAPLIYNLPASPFSITVTAGATTNLSPITWTPTRVGATVFEIGYPDRTAKKFRHGDDFWVGDIGPSPSAPSPVWSKWLEYPFDFPNGVSYVVGQSRWSTDWNFIQPVVTDSQGNYNSSSSTITFYLASAPVNGATASIYLGLTSDYYSAPVITVNGNNIGNVSGVSGSPNNSLPTSGYYVGYGESDTSIREGNNGAFSDERITFPASQFHAGANTINLGFRQIAANYFANHFMYDYVRLEMTGYVPPPPSGVVAYAGNNCNLVCWPVTPGATSYNILRSTVAGSGYASITNGVIGPVCGSGSNNAVYLDTTAVNGTPYYYVVRSVNPTGSSTNSPSSAAAIPLASVAATAPPTPTGLGVTSVGHQSVALNWNASPGANYYSVWRSTLMNTGGGSSNTLSTIILNNATAGTSFTDTTPTDGSIYNYFVTANSAGGTSGNSAVAAAVALPAAPASKPASLTAAFYQSTNIVLNWNAVPGAVGYVIKRATSLLGPYTLLQSVTETVYYDTGLNANSTYYYQVTAMNAAGVSITATNSANGLQPAPVNLVATGSDSTVTLSWPAATGATSYALKRGTSSGNETTTLFNQYNGLSYTNTGLVNETTYYYVLTASGSGGSSGASAEASATATAAASGTWAVDADGNWNTAANWSGGNIAYGTGNTADFSMLYLTGNRTITLDGDRTICGLDFGDRSGNFGWTLAGNDTLTLGTSPAIKVVDQSATINATLAGSTGLTKTGLGTLVLGGNAEMFTNGLAVNAGTLALDFSAANSPVTNIIFPTNVLKLGGGALQLIGSTNVANSQAFTSTTLNVGGSSLSSAPVSGNTISTVTIGAITPNLGATIEFNGPATIGPNNVAVPATAVITTTTLGAGGTTAPWGILGNDNIVGSIGHYATVGLYDWASTDTTTASAGTPPCPIIGGSQVTGFYTTTFPNAAGNFDLTANISSLGTGQKSASTIRFNTPTATSFTLTGGATTPTLLTCGGMLVTPNIGARNVTISSTTSTVLGQWQVVRTTSNGSQQGVLWQNNTLGYLNFNVAIVDGRQGTSTPTSIIQSGPGTVVYGGVNSYSSQTYLDGGFSVITADGGLGAPASAATVNLNGGTIFGNATFALDNAGANPRPLTLLGNGGGLAAASGSTMTVDGVISGSGPLSIGIPASGVNSNTPGLLPGSGAGTANTTPVYANGSVTVSNYNSFTGDITVNSGTLIANIPNNAFNPATSALGNPQLMRNITVNGGGTLQFIQGDTLGGANSTVLATLVINQGGTVTNNNDNFTTFGPIQMYGGTLTGGGGATAGYQMYNLLGTVMVGGMADSTIAGSGANAGYHLNTATTFNVASNRTLNVSATLIDRNATLGGAGGLNKTGAGTMTLSAANTYTGATALNAGVITLNAPETAGISGPLGNSGTITFGGGTLQYSAMDQYDYSGRFSAAANQLVSIDTAGQNVAFASPLAGGGGTLTKLGAGTLTLTGANTYDSGTFINNGTLAVNNPAGSGTGTGSVTVQSGGSLAGKGFIAGAVIVAANGALRPGNPAGTLTISNDLFLASGSTAGFQVQHSPRTNNAVSVSGALTQGGALTVTNSGAAAFTAGDSFKLFNATAYAGSFTSFNLPPLNAGLFWSTARLAVDGTLGVVSTNPPAVRSVALVGGNLVFQGTNGTPNWNYAVLCSTNLTLPLAQWTATATNVFDSAGNFSWTNSVSTGAQQFYVIQVQ